MKVSTKMRSDRIDSVTGLRAVAMLTIFCSHLIFLENTPFQGVNSWIANGRFGVNFFLVLSGFGMALGYSHKLNANSLIQDVQFVKRRISKIYIPYIITMILAVPLYILHATSGGDSLDGKLLIIRLLMNLGMIQSAIPFLKYSTSINEVSWFISTVFIIYLFTPGIVRLNNKTAHHYTLLKNILLSAAVLFLHCCIYMAIREIEYVRFADRGLSIIYISPLIRIFPFLLGIIGYNIYCILDHSRIKNGSFIEIPAIAGFFIWWITANKTGLPTVITECTDMLVSLLVVLIFAISRDGFVSGFLSNKKVMDLGKISLEFYLIHYLVINYGVMAAKRFHLDQGIAVLPLTILFFAISVCGAWLIHSSAEWFLSALKGKQTV